jgi:quinate dehydrogenase (quinone)
VNTSSDVDSRRRPRAPRIFAVLLGIIGAVLTAGGVQLISLGGSFYYAVAGIVLIASAVLLWRGQRWGAWLYGLLTLGTVIWALAESGFDGWALAPRILPFLVLGSFLLLPRTRRALSDLPPRPLHTSAITWASAVVLAGICVGVALHQPYASQPFPEAAGAAAPDVARDWQYWGGTAGGTRYAPFDQINAANAAKLDVAWTYRTGAGGAFKATPLQVGDSLYVCLAGNIVTALDVDTGKPRWRFDPKLKDSRVGFTTTCRGVTYYKSPEPVGECAERILTATTDARLIAIDAKTGQSCPGFGTNGEVSLLTGMGDVKPGFYYVTSPPTMARGIAVLGGWVADNVEVEEPSGVIRGFDALTGRLAWAWDLGRSEAMTELPEGHTYTRGTPNAWSVFSADEALGLVYIPTGNATPDYYGGHRTPESEKFASSVVALDAATGALRWSFQTTHHDIWDYDVPSQPVLVDIPDGSGGTTPALIAPTKRGELFLLDRRTGKPLADVEELPVPQTDVAQEATAPTQPFSTGMPSFGRELVTEQKMWGMTPIDQMLCRIQFRKLRYEGPLTPPSLRGSLQYPGFAGGMNWGSVSVDEASGVMIVNALQIGNHVRLYPRAEVTDKTKLGFGGGIQRGTPYAAFTTPFLSPLFAPCQQPPFGEIAAVDLKSRQTIWRRALGTANEIGPLGMKIRLRLPIGVPFVGGTIVTRGGLVFMGGTMDRHLRALDLHDGSELWSAMLPNNAQATPLSYVSPASQRQYVVITVPATDAEEVSHLAEPEAPRDAKGQIGGGGGQTQVGGGWIIAYALPDAARD